MRVLSQGFRSQIDEIAREVDPRADLQSITYRHPYEEDLGTPTLFDEPSEDVASSTGDASEKPVPKKKAVSKKKTVSKKRSGVKKKVVSKKGDDDERQ